MVLQGVPTMWLHVTLLTAMVSSTFVHADDRVLRNLATPDSHSDKNISTGKLEDLWEKEAALAEREVERFLIIGGGMSFTSRPSRSPLTGQPVGTPAPAVVPTRAPAPAPAPTPPPTLVPGTTPFPTPAMTTFRPTMGGTTAPPTLDTSCLLGRTPTQFLLDELSLITDTALLLDATTPQGSAFLFLDADPLLIDTGVCSYPTIEQRYGLATFYFSTNGESWTQDTGWLGTSGECDWFGVTCQDGTFTNDLLLRK
jgi:hypothetical protein